MADAERSVVRVSTHTPGYDRIEVYDEDDINPDLGLPISRASVYTEMKRREFLQKVSVRLETRLVRTSSSFIRSTLPSPRDAAVASDVIKVGGYLELKLDESITFPTIEVFN